MSCGSVHVISSIVVPFFSVVFRAGELCKTFYHRLRRGFAGRGGTDAELVLGGDPRVPSAESTEPDAAPWLPDWAGGYRLVVRSAHAEPLHRDVAHRYLVSAHLLRYPVGLSLFLFEKAEQVDLLVFDRGGLLRV